MSTYLYRAIATETVEPMGEWDIGTDPGDILGRQSGYLSRSSATDAGERSGVGFAIIRSKPIDFSQGTSKIERNINALIDLAAEEASPIALARIAQDIIRLRRKP